MNPAIPKGVFLAAFFVEVVAALDEDGLANLLRGMRVRRFRRGETIFHVGDPGDALFIVMSGSIKITLPAETGDEAIQATLQPGDMARVIGAITMRLRRSRSPIRTGVRRGWVMLVVMI